MKKIDHTGKRFGKLLIIGFSHSVFRSKRQGFYQYWKCVCDCGKEKVVLYNNLKSSNTTSCGCMSSRNLLPKTNTKHGKTRTPTYNNWRAMKDRCYGFGHSEYKRYGALGIKVCDRWKNSFENFLEDMGERPPYHSIDRINPFGDYSPENCRWADAKTQARNTKKNFLKTKAKDGDWRCISAESIQGSREPGRS